MKNSTFIRDNFKSSTLPRLKQFLIYSNTKKIDSCKILTEVLMEMPSNYSQEDLFERLSNKHNNLEFWKTYAKQDINNRVDAMFPEQILELAELFGIK